MNTQVFKVYEKMSLPCCERDQYHPPPFSLAFHGRGSRNVLCSVHVAEYHHRPQNSENIENGYEYIATIADYYNLVYLKSNDRFFIIDKESDEFELIFNSTDIFFNFLLEYYDFSLSVLLDKKLAYERSESIFKIEGVYNKKFLNSFLIQPFSWKE